MRRILIFTVCIVLSYTQSSCSNGTIYVSSSRGLSTNTGLDKEHPIKSVEEAFKLGKEIFLLAGDTFYVRGLTLNGKRLMRYGKGSNPTVCGYKKIVKPKWEEVKQNIWRLCLSDDNFNGINTKGSSISNNICAFHDYDNDQIHGRKVRLKEEMQNEWDFWQTEKLTQASPSDYDFIYLYLLSDPNKFRLEMSIYDCALQMTNSTVDGVNFEGYGFGISANSKSVIRNCKIDAIGGRIIPEGGGYVCYGNGIEFWVGGTTNIENCIVEDCYIIRCYDCGITIQGSNGTTATPRNIIVRNNLIVNCCQGWEDFLRNNPDVVYENCVFENNIVLNSGNTTGFGYAPNRFKYCHVLGNNFKGNKGMIIRNNTFVGGNYYCSGDYQGEYKSNVWKGNTCVIKRGDYILSNYMGTKDVIRIPNDKGDFASLSDATDDAIRRYRELTGDETTKFIIRDEKAINRQIVKLKKKYLRKNR